MRFPGAVLGGFLVVGSAACDAILGDFLAADGCYQWQYPANPCSDPTAVCSNGTCTCDGASCASSTWGTACVATQFYGTRCGCNANSECLGSGACCDTGLVPLIGGTADNQCYPNDPTKQVTIGGYYCLNGGWTNR
jgi:hypothetical protein